MDYLHADGKLGPDLTHLMSRTTIAAGVLPNNPGYLSGWIADPQSIKPGSLMPTRICPAPTSQASDRFWLRSSEGVGMTAAEYDRVPHIIGADYNSPIARSLERTWETKPGIIGWISSVDHKEVGVRYLVTAFIFLILGGSMALVMRLQLARPNGTILTAQQYNELFSAHAITMVFLYAQPVLSGFSNYLFPLVLGGRDMAFPRMNMFSYWLYLAAGLFMYSSILVGAVPNNGWFNYAPFSLKEYNPGLNMDFYALGMIFLGISTTVGSANFLVTFMRMRAPGMSINRVPILTWGTTTISVGNLLAVPSVSLAFLLLWLDWRFGTHFYRPEGGGQPLLWQHLFWMFAHPWVYVVALPAIGMVSDALPFFCRRPLVGYASVVLGTITTMALGFGVWLHHMFATGFRSSRSCSSAALPLSSPSRAPSLSSPGSPRYGRAVRS